MKILRFRQSRRYSGPWRFARRRRPRCCHSPAAYRNNPWPLLDAPRLLLPRVRRQQRDRGSQGYLRAGWARRSCHKTFRQALFPRHIDKRGSFHKLVEERQKLLTFRIPTLAASVASTNSLNSRLKPLLCHASAYLVTRKRKNVLPTIISSPSFNGWRSPEAKRWPRFTNVPFVDPRSSIKYFPSRSEIRA